MNEKPVAMTFRLGQAEADYLRETAAKEDRSITSVLRRAIRQAMAQDAQDQAQAASQSA